MKLKFKNLKKLSFKKEEIKTTEKDIDKLIKILEEQDLKIENKLEEKFDIFEAISYNIYKNTSQKERLEKITQNYLNNFFTKKQKFPENLEFLENNYFMEIYQKKQNHHFFEGVN